MIDYPNREVSCMKRLRIAVLVADDTSPAERASIEALVHDALDGLLLERGGEITLGAFDPTASLALGVGAHTVSYAGPRPKKGKPS